MTRLFALILALVLAGCDVRQPKAELCNMPWGLHGWGGVTLRVTGLVVGGAPHGFVLTDEQCLRGGQLDIANDAVNRDHLERRLDSVGVAHGLTRIDVEAKIEELDDAGPILRVTRYYGGSFQAMSEVQERDYFNHRYGERALSTSFGH